MRHFLNLSIKWKLVLGYSIGVFSLLVVAGTAIQAMTALRDAQRDIQEIQLANVIDYLALDANLNKSRALLYRMLRNRDPAERETTRRAIIDASGENDAIMARLSERVVRDPLPQDRFAALKAARDRFNRVRDGQIIPAILAGREAEAEAAFDASTEHYRETSALAAEMAGLAKDNARSEVEQSIALVWRATLALGAIAVATIALSALAIVALNRAIAVPIVATAGAATRIAEGELDLAMPGEERQDEIGELARAFNRMTASLRDLADIADHIADGDLTDPIRPRSKRDRLAVSFDVMSENLKGLTSEIKTGAAEVESATMDVLELTREFVMEMADPDKARRFQDTLLRLEEVSRRLNTVIGRVKLPAGRVTWPPS